MGSFCILGGSGFVGSRLAAHLAASGHRLRVPSRRPDRARGLWVLPTVRLEQADIHDPAALRGLTSGQDAVVNLVGILNEEGYDGAGFRHVHVDLVKKLIDACRSTGVKRLIHVSALNAGNPAATSHYLVTKGEAEVLLRESGLDVTLLRPSVIFGPGDAFLNRFARLLRLSPLVFPLAMPDARFSPAHVDDVVAAIGGALRNAGAPQTSFDLAGSETRSLREIVSAVATTLGLHRAIVGLPPRLSLALARIMERLPGKPFSVDNYRSLLIDSVADTSGFAALGVTAPQGVSAGLAASIGAATGPDDLSRYRRRARR